MALFNIFKKKKKREKAKEELKEKKEEVPQEARKEAVLSTPIWEEKKEKLIATLVLKSPHITEKSSDLADKNQYVFKVYPKINKIEIRKAIEELYGVKVVSIKTINVPAKQKRLGKNIGEQKGYKKAIVKIKEGQKIEVLPR